VNTGEPAKDVKEGESRERKNLEYSDAEAGSQRSHSTRSLGKPGTGGRTPPEEVSEYILLHVMCSYGTRKLSSEYSEEIRAAGGTPG
jgi:hypothetical protein